MPIVLPQINYIKHRDFAIVLFEIVYFRKCKREVDQPFSSRFFVGIRTMQLRLMTATNVQKFKGLPTMASVFSTLYIASTEMNRWVDLVNLVSITVLANIDVNDR